MCKHTLVNEVEAELKKYPGVIASVNEATGRVATFLAPVSPAATSKELQKQIDALVAALPKLKGGARSKADHKIRVLQRELRVALDREESERRHAERSGERQRQQVGADSPFARQTLAELVASTVAAVNAAVGTTKQVKNTLTWDTLRRDLDARVPKAPQKKVCCSGKYLCSTCANKAAAA